MHGYLPLCLSMVLMLNTKLHWVRMMPKWNSCFEAGQLKPVFDPIFACSRRPLDQAVQLAMELVDIQTHSLPMALRVQQLSSTLKHRTLQELTGLPATQTACQEYASIQVLSNCQSMVMSGNGRPCALKYPKTCAMCGAVPLASWAVGIVPFLPCVLQMELISWLNTLTTIGQQQPHCFDLTCYRRYHAILGRLLLLHP